MDIGRTPKKMKEQKKFLAFSFPSYFR